MIRNLFIGCLAWLGGLSLALADVTGLVTPPGGTGAGTPGGSSGQVQYNNAGVFGGSLLTYAANGGNGLRLQLTPQSTSGTPHSIEKPSIVTNAESCFTGNYYCDWIQAFGYNFDPNTGIIDTTDPYATAWQFETNYEPAVKTSTATSGTTTTTLNDTTLSLSVNGLINYTLYDSTRGASALITSNTATSVTVGTPITGMTSGDSYQILVHNAETYLATDFVPDSIRPYFMAFNKSHSNIGPITITGATNANPVVFTTSGPHGLVSSSSVFTNTDYVWFTGLPGTFGSTMNSNQYIVTIVDSTHFSVPVNSTSFGSYTSGGTAQIVPVAITSNIMVSNNALSGLQFYIPPANLAINSNNLLAEFNPNGTFQFYQPGANGLNGSPDTVMQIFSGTGSNSRIDMYGGNYTGGIILTSRTTAVEPGREQKLLFDSGGANGQILYDCTRNGSCQIGDTGYTSITVKNSSYASGFSLQPAYSSLSYQPGLITSIVNTKSVYSKVVKSSTVDNIEGSAQSLTTCTTNPTITMYECGTDATCASPTTIGSTMITATGQAFDGTVSNAAIGAGHYVGWAISAGACASLDIGATAQVHTN
jgi:hypothetical protein